MVKKLITKYRSLSVHTRASFWFLISGFFSRGVSVITTPIFTRLLTTQEYGRYSVFSSWEGIVTVIVTLNLFSGVFVQGLVKYEDRRKEYASSLQGLCFTLCLVWTVIYLLFRDFWNELLSLTTVQVLAMLLIVWSSAVYNFWSATQRVKTQYKALVLITMIVTVLKPAFSIFLILHAEDKVMARILGILITQMIAYSSFFFIQMVQGRKFFSGEFWKHALKFNIPLVPHYLSMTVLNSADRIMIQDLVGEGEVGIYNLAYSVAQIMTIFNTALLQTIEPWLYKRIKAKEIGKISGVAYPVFIAIAALNLILILFAPEVILLFAPIEYYDAIWVIPSVALSVYFTFLYTFFAAFEFHFEKTKQIMAASICGAVLNIVLNYIFIPVFGYVAAGYTTLACYMLFALVHYLSMVKLCKQNLDGKKPYDTKYVLMISVGFLILGFLIQFTYNNVYIRYSVVAGGVLLAIWKRKVLMELINNLIRVKNGREAE